MMTFKIKVLLFNVVEPLKIVDGPLPMGKIYQWV